MYVLKPPFRAFSEEVFARIISTHVDLIAIASSTKTKGINAGIAACASASEQICAKKLFKMSAIALRAVDQVMKTQLILRAPRSLSSSELRCVHERWALTFRLFHFLLKRLSFSFPIFPFDWNRFLNLATQTFNQKRLQALRT